MMNITLALSGGGGERICSYWLVTHPGKGRISRPGGGRNQRRLEQPEVIIRPRLGQVGIMDRVNISGLINSGERATMEAALPSSGNELAISYTAEIINLSIVQLRL